MKTNVTSMKQLKTTLLCRFEAKHRKRYNLRRYILSLLLLFQARIYTRHTTDILRDL